MKKIKNASLSRIILISTICVLNLAGISYAYWNNGLNIMALVSTGDLELQFAPNSSYELISGNGNLNVVLVDDHTILIDGSVEEAVSEVTELTEEATVISPVYSDYEGLIRLSIKNAGDIPAVFANTTLNDTSGKVEIVPGTHQGVILPDTGNGVISQEIKVRSGEGFIDFSAEFLFNQPE